MKTETAPAKASRDPAVRVRGISGAIRAESSSTNESLASTRWLRKAASTSEPIPKRFPRFHMGFPSRLLSLLPIPSDCPNPYVRQAGTLLRCEKGSRRGYRGRLSVGGKFADVRRVSSQGD